MQFFKQLCKFSLLLRHNKKVHLPQSMDLFLPFSRSQFLSCHPFTEARYVYVLCFSDHDIVLFYFSMNFNSKIDFGFYEDGCLGTQTCFQLWDPCHWSLLCHIWVSS